MEKRRVALLCTRQLLGESLEHLLKNNEDIALLGPWALDSRSLSHLVNEPVDIVLIVEPEGGAVYSSKITAQILDRFPDISIIRVTLENNTVRCYSSQTLPARSSDLIDLIRKLSPGSLPSAN
jgi:hypothetical protein